MKMQIIENIRKSVGILMFSGLIACTGCGSNDGGGGPSTPPDTGDDPDMNTLVFYYNWYGIPEFDGQLYHWAHDIIPQGNNPSPGRIPGTDNDIAANFFPEGGIYSSKDRIAIRRHMEEMKQARTGVVALTWWKNSDVGQESIPIILDEAERAGLQVCFHIEPYGGRTAASVKKDMKALVDAYGRHKAFFRVEGKPMFIVYDSYLIDADSWAEVLSANGKETIRGTAYDAVVIGLLLSVSDRDYLKMGGFNGFYTYFASTGFTEGSTPDKWAEMQTWCAKNNMTFIPCVGPGYIDTRVRPWNQANIKDREGGQYYDRMFSKAISSGAPFIGITSYNEWHEGTQIEPARPMISDDGKFTYLDFSPQEPDFYLEKTAELVGRFISSRGE